ncbi:MAG: SurA N-terminal domain-containing protein [Rickettsiales bacterium]|jgi:peptidyl-prolyl cis-trans isomerase SurA|nr:SurA N-terminal domain-containing protein [Rickettsiales bacterium]
MFRMIFAAVFALMLALAASASEGVRILAVVNGEAITSYEFRQRVGLSRALIKNAGLKVRDAEIEKSVFEEMVGDKVKTTEAAKYGISATPDEVAQMRARMESALGLGSGGYDRILEEAGVSEDTLRSVLAADATWMKFVSQVLRMYVQVRDGDVDSAVGGMEKREIVDYAVVPLITGPKDAQRVYSEVEGMSDCDGFAKAAGRLGERGSGSKVELSDLEMQPALLEIVKDAPVLRPLAPREVGGRTTIFFVCGKAARAFALTEAERERLKYEILQGKLDAYGARYFENAKANSVIEIKGR